MSLITIFSGFLGVAVLACLILAAWYFRYRFVSFVRHEQTPDMESRIPEGYTDKPFYYRGETISFLLRSDAEQNNLSIRRMSGPNEFQELYTVPFGRMEQSTPPNASETGCEWIPSFTVPVGDDFMPGYYQALLTEEKSQNKFEIYFIIGEKKPASIVIVAPVSTWTAYNPWGGKSLYQNKFENKTVHFVSTQRPNTAFELNHDIQVEANIFNWFSATYLSVSVIPDYMLEEAGMLDTCQLLVLSYHCEYISKPMHLAVRLALDRGVSLISLGANQLYWVVRWNASHTIMECRKDLTNFEHSLSYGGMWKHHFRPQQKYLGGHYNPLGMHTFAPYRITAKKEHWILAGLDVQPGDLFGMAGIDGKPICGTETDKTTGKKNNLEIIARGLNCESESAGTLYDANDPMWNGSGGGEMTITYHSNGAVLNTAAIHSGAGLGVDPIFTGIIKNFVKRFGSGLTMHDEQDRKKLEARFSHSSRSFVS